MSTHSYRNTFHNTEARSRYSRDELDRAIMLWHSSQEESPALRAARRLRHKLCGREGCTCGNSWGERR